MWVDEGDGQIPAQLAKAAAVLDHAPHLAGQMRKPARPFPAAATRPAPPSPPAVTTVIAWLEWQEDRGDRLVAEVTGSAPSSRSPRTCSDRRRPSPPTVSRGWSSAGPVARWACGPPASSTAGGATRNRSATPTAPRSTRRSPPPRTAACRCAGRAGQVAGSRSSPGGGTARVGSDGPGTPENRAADFGQRVGPGLAIRRRGRRLRLDRVPSTAATPSRCAHRRARRRRPGPAASPAAATTRCTPAWPRPRRPPVVRFRRGLGAGPRRERAHPAAPAARRRRVGPVDLDGPEGVREPGAACRRSCCPRSTRTAGRLGHA